MDWDWWAWRWLSNRTAKGALGLLVAAALALNVFGFRDWVFGMYQERAQHRVEWLMKSFLPQASSTPSPSSPAPSAATATAAPRR